MPPEVKTSGCQTDKFAEGTVERTHCKLSSPFSGLGFSAARGFNLWWWKPIAYRKPAVEGFRVRGFSTP
jgi:hypothetical protein